MCKAGLSGEDNPRAVFPAVVGVPKYKTIMMMGSGDKIVYVGSDVLPKRGILKMNYPIEHGIIDNWDDMELIWNHCY